MPTVLCRLDDSQSSNYGQNHDVYLNRKYSNTTGGAGTSVVAASLVDFLVIGGAVLHFSDLDLGKLR